MSKILKFSNSILFITSFAATGLLQAEANGNWVNLLEKESLESWTKHGGAAEYELHDGVIIGRSRLNTPNTFLAPEGEYGDFELEFEVRCGPINSGMQIRSKPRLPDGRARINGPQVEIEQSPGQSGYIYGEALGGGWRSPEPTSKDRSVKQHRHFKNNAWNHYRIRAVGPRIQTWLNGKLIADLTDEPLYETHAKGLLGLQVHGHKKAGVEIEWRKLRIREIDSSDR